VEGTAVKQRVSAPFAAIILALAILFSLVVFSRPKPVPEDEVYVLPYSPPLDESQLKALRTGLRPLGIAIVMPPLGQDRFKGARVAAVAPGSPAGKGGLKAGDLITQFNGVGIAQPFAVAAMVARADPKKPNELVVKRAGKEQKLVITGIKPVPLEERPRL
jgi:S1-C subfamily serine protease